MRLFLVVLLLFVSFKILGQTNSQIVLVDKVSQEPVPYATVRTGSLTIFSDHNGRISPDLIRSDEVTISRLGYQDLTIMTSALTDTIKLIPSPFTLRTIEISGNEKRMEGGYHSTKTYGRISGNVTKGVGVIIKDLPSGTRISKVFVHTKGNTKGYTYLISLFTVDSLGLPDRLIYYQKYQSPDSKNKLSISLEANVHMDNQLIVIFDWTPDTGVDKNSNDHTGVRMTREINEPLSFQYAKHINRWIRFDMSKSLGFHWNYKIGIEYIEN